MENEVRVFSTGIRETPFGGSSDDVHIAFRQGSQEWLLSQILGELKQIRKALAPVEEKKP